MLIHSENTAAVRRHVPAVFTGLIIGHVEHAHIAAPGKAAAVRRRYMHSLVSVFIILVIVIASHVDHFLSQILMVTVSPERYCFIPSRPDAT